MRRTASTLSFLVASACSGNGGSVAPEKGTVNLFVGTYVLETINGSALPVTYPPAGAPVEITRGTLTIRPDGTFTLTDYLRNAPVSGGVTSEESGGTYQTTDSDISLVFVNKAVTGHLSGDDLIVLRGEPAFRYRR